MDATTAGNKIRSPAKILSPRSPEFGVAKEEAGKSNVWRGR